MKNLRTLMFALMVSGGIANAATLSQTTQVSANFQVISQCTVTGSWAATTPINAGPHVAFAADLGILTVQTDGCSPNGVRVYFEGAEKGSDGRILATTPGGGKMSVVPDPSITYWPLDPSLGVYFNDDLLGVGMGVTNVTLVNGDSWDAQPGVHQMTLNVGIYNI
ncbi:CD15/CS22/SEF14 family fimbrial major subunit [Providencia alcalifaciens]|uniref:CD15/CS22/SEF14 family fimbrial major subunit n=1 Tax=Providencia alcalifaciens TaxID=126385 RepID=UPI0015D03D82|nr:CD15/CS22/SEF14 family fimbrial major subunit [Providencia alcalifaciens]MBF0693368.1 CD15/CS22/SEF14 family fimbrial major subunit [Providencia alcalifaciens]NYS91872.1 CD15/CS22/SEF14 family fimbrial major subunit [Providencia alcalifaciens]